MKKLKKIRDRRAQAIMSEYVLMFFVAFAAITAMSVYFQRSIQDRIRAARNTMGKIVYDRTGNAAIADLRMEYEPYYINTSVDVDVDESRKKGHFLGGGTRVEVSSTVSAQSAGETAPPKLAD